MDQLGDIVEFERGVGGRSDRHVVELDTTAKGCEERDILRIRAAGNTAVSMAHCTPRGERVYELSSRGPLFDFALRS